MNFKDKSILITGGIRSLGKVLTRLLISGDQDIKRLVIFSWGEQKQYQMTQKYPFDKYPQIRFFSIKGLGEFYELPTMK